MPRPPSKLCSNVVPDSSTTSRKKCNICICLAYRKTFTSKSSPSGHLADHGRNGWHPCCNAKLVSAWFFVIECVSKVVLVLHIVEPRLVTRHATYLPLALPLQGPPSYHQGQQNSPILVNSCRVNTVHGIKDTTGLLKSKVVARDETCWAILKSRCNQHKMKARA
jgi:hypothetical protein